MSPCSACRCCVRRGIRGSRRSSARRTAARLRRRSRRAGATAGVDSASRSARGSRARPRSLRRCGHRGRGRRFRSRHRRRRRLGDRHGRSRGATGAAAAPCGPRCGSSVEASTNSGVAAIFGRPACWCSGGSAGRDISLVVAPGLPAPGRRDRFQRQRRGRSPHQAGLAAPAASAAGGLRRSRTLLRWRSRASASSLLLLGRQRLVGSASAASRSSTRQLPRLLEVGARLAPLRGVRRAHSAMRCWVRSRSSGGMRGKRAAISSHFCCRVGSIWRPFALQRRQRFTLPGAEGRPGNAAASDRLRANDRGSSPMPRRRASGVWRGHERRRIGIGSQRLAVSAGTRRSRGRCRRRAAGRRPSSAASTSAAASICSRVSRSWIRTRPTISSTSGSAEPNAATSVSRRPASPHGRPCDATTRRGRRSAQLTCARQRLLAREAQALADVVRRLARRSRSSRAAMRARSAPAEPRPGMAAEVVCVHGAIPLALRALPRHARPGSSAS